MRVLSSGKVSSSAFWLAFSRIKRHFSASDKRQEAVSALPRYHCSSKTIAPRRSYSIRELSVSRIVSTCSSSRSVLSASVNTMSSAARSKRFCGKSRKLHPMPPAKASTSTATMIPIVFLFMTFLFCRCKGTAILLPPQEKRMEIAIPPITL